MKKFDLQLNILPELNTALNHKKNCSVFGLSFGEKSIFLCSQKRQIVFVTCNMVEADKLALQLESFGKTVKTIFFTESNFVLGSNTTSQSKLDALEAIKCLSTTNVDCLIISPESLYQKFPQKSVFCDHLLRLKQDEILSQNICIKRLVEIGYQRVDTVLNAGDFSVRGDTIDVFNILDQVPTRIEFFYDKIEKITQYYEDDYKKICDIKSVLICPTSICLFDSASKDTLFSTIESDFQKTCKNLEINSSVILRSRFEEFKVNFDAGNFSFIQNWLFPYLQDSIQNYVNDDAIFVFDDVKQIVDAVNKFYQQFDVTFKSLIASGDVLQSRKIFYVDIGNVYAIKNQMLSFQQITTSNRIFAPEQVFSFKTSATTNYFGNYSLLNEDIKYFVQFGYTVLIFCKTNQLAQYLQKYLSLQNVDALIFNDLKIESNKVNLITKYIPSGAIFVEDKIAIIGSDELQKKEAKKRVEVIDKNQEFVLPKVGDYVVHETFGIGLCVGIEKLKFTDYQKDYIILQYDRGDKLYLPTEQIGLISAYVGGNGTPKLNRLGTKDFENTKQKVKNSLKKLAFDLVKLYSERERAKGFKFEIDKKMYDEFENSFPYEETVDQESAIKDIKSDMINGKVMDRLVCGDVGYGKTEVALRAAFICAMNSKQTAFLAPTTVLSEQHFNTAKERLSRFGISVERLNRFRTKKEQDEIIKRLKNGEVDVICGTHRLLSKDVGFKNLGLLILDEEQRFGVADKEKIKRLKTNVDVLTLSATPIPRTLHMGLVGIRDISLIATAPNGRLPVQTTVTEFSDALVLQAINREIARDGQVLIIYNRIDTIYSFASHIRALLNSDITIGVAHGQLDQNVLEKQIFDLYSGKTKVLISTTLIENGVDLPNANTLIIVDADKLGLSQLYQLKGRVGRSKTLGYAYFTYDKNKALTEDAYKRLNAIMEFTELGSGFKIAMKDLEIRGCGNILGPEQSGHLAKIGYDLYCKILSEAINEVKVQIQKQYPQINLHVPINCHIPDNL